jgi:hypothetical protein
MKALRYLLLALALYVTGCSNDPTDPLTSGAIPDQTNGNWTPTLGGNTVYSMQTGRWTKTGTHVWVTGQLQVVTLGTGSATQVCGLPFPSIDGQEPSGTVGHYKNLNQAVSTLTVTVRPNSDCLAFHATLGSSTDMVTISPLKDGSLIYFSVSYETP